MKAAMTPLIGRLCRCGIAPRTSAAVKGADGGRPEACLPLAVEAALKDEHRQAPGEHHDDECGLMHDAMPCHARAAAALELFGFGPCLQMQDVWLYPALARLWNEHRAGRRRLARGVPRVPVLRRPAGLLAVARVRQAVASGARPADCARCRVLVRPRARLD